MWMPEREFLRSEYYNDFLRKFDVCYHLGGCVLMQESAGTVFVVNRPRRAGAFGKTEIALVRVLMPHFRRSLQLRGRLGTIEAQNRGLRESIDALPTGFLLVDSRAKITFMNRCAETILAQDDGLSSSAQVLRTAFPSQNEKLLGMVRAAAMTSAGKLGGAGGAMAISRRTLRRAYSVFVCPLRGTREQIPGVPSAVAALFISDPELCTQSDEKVLRQLFGLSMAESRLTSGSLLRVE